MSKPINTSCSDHDVNPLDKQQVDAEILKLALPSLATLLAEPLLVAADSTMVGRLSTTPLAGLSLSSTILTTLVGLCIFLAYASTAATARLVGAGKPKQGLRQGIDSLWLAAGLGIILGAILFFGSPVILEFFHPSKEVLAQAIFYTKFSCFGLPGMLLVLAATGTLRGFADAKTPLYASTAGALLNIPLNYILIYVLHMGVGGAGLGTAIAQTLMAIYLMSAIRRRAHHLQVSAKPTGVGVLRSLREAIPLIVRTLSLRGAILLQIAAATSLGTVALAANQIVMTVWNFAAYGLDSLATAAQILVGQNLGSQDKHRVHHVLHRCLSWGARVGFGLGIILGALSFFIPRIMTTDPSVQHLATQTMWVTSVSMPIAAIAYMLDGVLIGAGDTRKLARYMVAALIVFAPVPLIILLCGSSWGMPGMLLLWGGYALLFMVARGITMFFRVRGNSWMGF
ncbi:MATE family efflux transporter [Arcanobacterium ihumii]|uniref:MATE family efflux transporter n=1 Tax=Arcanobacterium ihumii TaxID=2138162 RepID=UPI000F532247|nr:MATE family efflux transporter [Arcanobacterium ihumii]